MKDLDYSEEWAGELVMRLREEPPAKPASNSVPLPAVSQSVTSTNDRKKSTQALATALLEREEPSATSPLQPQLLRYPGEQDYQYQLRLLEHQYRQLKESARTDHDLASEYRQVQLKVDQEYQRRQALLDATCQSLSIVEAVLSHDLDFWPSRQDGSMSKSEYDHQTSARKHQDKCFCDRHFKSSALVATNRSPMNPDSVDPDALDPLIKQEAYTVDLYHQRILLKLLRRSPLPLAHPRHLHPRSNILLFTPVLPPIGCSPSAFPIHTDPFEPFGRALSWHHRRVQHVPYEPSTGFTGTHETFVQQPWVVMVIVVVCTPAWGERVVSVGRQELFAGKVLDGFTEMKQRAGHESVLVRVGEPATQAEMEEGEWRTIVQAQGWEHGTGEAVAESIFNPPGGELGDE
ncbi:uncharacterized protein LTR77_010590 [Saxophila tyrrhenica]|uniref:Uncharacterized protein n=1 Tax=Saxophila tyrrhenica TaxID=1690608 RepID=A0AAV9NXQ9_9PEZI|nr:hypothetical protein LTR77_010590 [Saxophila tyrrhenica]